MSWPLVSLHDLCRPKQWKTIASSKLLESGYPVYGANGTIGYYSEFTHEHPTLMITCRGATCGNVHISHPKSYINGNAMALDNLDESQVFLKYLFYYFKARGFSDVISGSAQPQITGQGLKKVQIPLPPLDEQKRIAAILDKADAIRQKRKQAIDLADEFLRSVFLEMFGDPVTNPKGWEVTTCGETFKLSSGKGLTAKNMDKDGNYLVYGGNGINGKHSEYMFEEPQLIIGRVGVYCGSIHITEKKSWVTDNAMYIKEYLKKVNIIFLAQLLDLANLNQYAGKAAQPLISGNRIYPLEIIFPPIEEQERFAKIHKVFIESITKLHGGLESKSDLFQSLSQKAFSGQL